MRDPKQTVLLHRQMLMQYLIDSSHVQDLLNLTRRHMKILQYRAQHQRFLAQKLILDYLHDLRHLAIGGLNRIS